MVATFGLSLLVFLLCASPCTAWVSYELNCTAPPDGEGINFVSSADVRSTMDIVWSSLSILLLCTWNAMHLSVPSHFDEEEKSWKGWFKARWKESSSKATWMLVMLISPEYLFGKGMMENFAAQHSVKMFGQKEKWTATHAYFANMRGLVLRFKVKSAKHKSGLMPTDAGKGSQLGLEVTRFSKDDEVPYEEQDARRAEEIELMHCRENCHPLPPTAKELRSPEHEAKPEKLAMTTTEEIVTVADSLSPSDQVKLPDKPVGDTITSRPSSPRSSMDYLQHPSEKPNSLPDHEEWVGTWALDASQWYEAYDLKIINTPPQVDVEAIKDRSKGDGLAKALAILQITWLVVQVIARAFEHIAITLLEVTVLAFATTAIAIYITIWSKPQGVKVPIFIDADRLITRQDVIKLAARAPKSSLVVHEFWLHGVCVRGMADNVFPYAPGIPIPFTKDKNGHSKHHISAVTLGIGLGGAIFGAVHCAAWNFNFPSDTEKLLWRIACIFICGSPMPFAFFYIFTQQRAKVGGKTEAWTRRLMLLPLLLMMPVYLLFRFYLMVEACRALAYPEMSTFQDVQWPSFIPHLG